MALSRKCFVDVWQRNHCRGFVGLAGALTSRIPMTLWLLGLTFSAVAGAEQGSSTASYQVEVLGTARPHVAVQAPVRS